MGTQNRQRRAAKARKRAKQHANRSGGGGWRPPRRDRPDEPSPTERARELLHLAAMEPGSERGEMAVDELAHADVALVDREAGGLLLTGISTIWNNGWQPAELVRHARRSDVRVGRLMAAVVAVDHARRDPSTLHPRWAAQVATLELPEVEDVMGWMAAFGRREWLDRLTFVGLVVAALHLVYTVHRLPTIIPPPGSSRPRSLADVDPTIDDPVLVRVRALLAQAESTTFEAEAETFTAKAQALMARHSIDAAVLWATTQRDERPVTIRLPIDDPYADIKSLLLQRVALHSRCTAVWNIAYALSTIVGFASDVATTEMLFTSLLVQSQAALQAEASKAPPGARVRSRGFRTSFLMAYTQRIDQRLAEITAAVEEAADVEAGHSLLPVLVSRGDAVKDTVEELFGSLVSTTVSGGSDVAGWTRGTLAANLAELNAGRLPTG